MAVAKLERDALFKRLRAKPENKVRVYTECLPWPYGILYLVLLTERRSHVTVWPACSVCLRTCSFPFVPLLIVHAEMHALYDRGLREARDQTNTYAKSPGA